MVWAPSVPLTTIFHLVDMSAQLSGENKLSGPSPTANSNIIFAPCQTVLASWILLTAIFTSSTFPFSGTAPAANGEIIFLPCNTDSGHLRSADDGCHLVDNSAQCSGQDKFIGAAANPGLFAGSRGAAWQQRSSWQSIAHAVDTFLGRCMGIAAAAWDIAWSHIRQSWNIARPHMLQAAGLLGAIIFLVIAGAGIRSMPSNSTCKN